MKFSNIRFLSKANIKRNKYNVSITVIVSLLVAAVSLISSYAVATVNAVNEYKTDYQARSVTLLPWEKPLTDDAIKAISNVEHVQSVDDVAGLEISRFYNILGVSKKKDGGAEISKQLKTRTTYVTVEGLIGDEKKPVIAGKNLEESPTFSCIIPNLFYPFEDEGNIGYENLDYIDGTSLIGETITLKGDEGKILLPYNIVIDDGECTGYDANLRSKEIKLKIVGAFNCSSNTYGSFHHLFVSRDTQLQIMEKAMKNTGIDLSSNESDISKWWNNTSLHNYYVVADDYDNITSIYNEVSEMGYDISSFNNFSIKESTKIMADVLSTVGMFLLSAIFILAVILLLQSTNFSFNSQKSNIGLLKAIGYKNKYIFACMLYEQLFLVIRAFLIGAASSLVFVTVLNYIFSHKSYGEFIYIIDYSMLAAFLGIALVLVTVIVAICEIVLISKIVKIQPREAMSAA